MYVHAPFCHFYSFVHMHHCSSVPLILDMSCSSLPIYRTRSNYLNTLIARTACLLILFPSHFIEYAEFLVSYPFYLIERLRPASRCNINSLNYGRSLRVRFRVQLHCGYYLFVDGEGRGSTNNCGGIFTTKENIDCCLVLFVSISFQLHSNKQV